MENTAGKTGTSTVRSPVVRALEASQRGDPTVQVALPSELLQDVFDAVLDKVDLRAVLAYAASSRPAATQVDVYLSRTPKVARQKNILAQLQPGRAYAQVSPGLDPSLNRYTAKRYSVIDIFPSTSPVPQSHALSISSDPRFRRGLPLDSDVILPLNDFEASLKVHRYLQAQEISRDGRYVYMVGFMPREHDQATRSQNITLHMRIIDMATKARSSLAIEVFKPFDGTVVRVHPSPQGTYLAVSFGYEFGDDASDEPAQVVFVDLRSKQMKAISFAGVRTVRDVQFAPDEQYCLVRGSRRSQFNMSQSDIIHAVKLGGAEYLPLWHGLTEAICAGIYFSAAGERFALLDSEHSLQIFELDKNKETVHLLHEIDCHAEPRKNLDSRSLQFWPNPETLVFLARQSDQSFFSVDKTLHVQHLGRTMGPPKALSMPTMSEFVCSTKTGLASVPSSPSSPSGPSRASPGRTVSASACAGRRPASLVATHNRRRGAAGDLPTDPLELSLRSFCQLAGLPPRLVRLADWQSKARDVSDRRPRAASTDRAITPGG
jgi:hypothetical protein